MIWRKSWLECRFRVLLCTAVGLLLAFAGLFSFVDPAKHAVEWPIYCRLLLNTLMAITVVNLAGSGINSQSRWGLVHGFHPSMYFLLSLPISRRRALLIRAAVGMVFTFLIVAVGAFCFGLFAPLRGVRVGMNDILSAVAFLSIFAYALFGFTTFLTTTLDEVVSGILGFAFAAFLLGAGHGMSGGRRHLEPLAFIDGELFVRTGHIIWPAIAVLIAIGTIFMLASIYVVERKEY